MGPIMSTRWLLIQTYWPVSVVYLECMHDHCSVALSNGICDSCMVTIVFMSDMVEDMNVGGCGVDFELLHTI